MTEKQQGKKRAPANAFTKERAETVGRTTRFKPGNVAAVKYTEEHAERVLALIAEGMTNAQACGQPDMPSTRSLHAWRTDYPEFEARYRAACEVRAQAMLERSIAESDRARPKSNPEVAHAKLKFEKLRYYLTNTTRGEFSDRITQQHVGRLDGPIQTVQTNFDDPVEAAQAYQKLIRGD